MGITLVTGPLLEPVSLAEVKAHCRVFINDDDAILAGYLIAARQHIESVTHRALMSQTLDYTIDYGWPFVGHRGDSCKFGFGLGVGYNYPPPKIRIPRPPLISITSVSYVDQSGVTQTLAADQYFVSKKQYVGAIEPAYSVIWPYVRPQSEAITIRFVAGYGSNPGDVPEAIRQAILLMVSHLYENPTAVDALVRSTFQELPLGVDALIYPHRVIEFG